jgi:uncharacterized protein YgiM (DUF1202 family)
MTIMKPLWSIFLTLLGLAIMSISITVKAQQRALWRGVVKPVEINVYAGASTGNTIATTLKQGEMVDVILEISDMGGGWCRIASSGQSEALGYVLCTNLDRSGVAPKDSTRNYPAATRSDTRAPIAATPHTGTEQPSSKSGVLTNKDVLDMNKVGLPPEILVAKIKSSQCNFDTSPQQLQQLKSGGVTDAIILAMVQAPTSAVANDPTVPQKSAAIVGDDLPEANSTPAPGGKVFQGDPISPGSQVFIEPMSGFESYLSAALQKKHVPLVIVASEEKADFVITGDSDTKKAGWAKIIFMGDLHSDEEASVTMVNKKTGQVVFAYAVNKKNTLHGQQTSAEACAKHLKGRIEGKE